MITYKFNKKKGILETTIKGEISIKELFAYIYTLSEEKDLPKVLKIFTDASEGRIGDDINYEELPKIMEANKYHLQKREKIYDAFVLSSSMETALSQLYMELNNSKNYYFNIFSSKKYALNWLNKF